MKSKIFSAIVTACAVAFVSAFLPLFIAVEFDLGIVSKIVLPAFSLILPIVVTLVLAKIFAKKIIAPIERLDLDKPDIDKSYGEIDSLIHKISRQNRLIDRQMQDLRRRQVEFTAITENMSEGIVILDDKSEILSYNNAAINILGADNVKEGEHFISLSRSRRFVATVNEAFEGRHGEDTITIGQSVYQIFANPVTVSDMMSGIVIVLLDITEKEKREEMRREFTSNVSHELKTPLTTISGISELFMSEMVAAPDIPKFAKNIHDEAARLLELINDIIKLSRLDEATDPVLPDTVDLCEVVNEVRHRLLMPAAARDIQIIVDALPLTVTGSRSILTEMVYNLIDNAIKYNKEGGNVKIRVWEAEGRISLSVSDTGIGIPAQHHSRIFERFYRVDKSHSREVGGTGLGLSIVRHAAEYHRATLGVESTEGVGTTITVTFPEK